MSASHHDGNGSAPSVAPVVATSLPPGACGLGKYCIMVREPDMGITDMSRKCRHGKGVHHLCTIQASSEFHAEREAQGDHQEEIWCIKELEEYMRSKNVEFDGVENETKYDWKVTRSAQKFALFTVEDARSLTHDDRARSNVQSLKEKIGQMWPDTVPSPVGIFERLSSMALSQVRESTGAVLMRDIGFELSPERFSTFIGMLLWCSMYSLPVGKAIADFEKIAQDASCGRLLLSEFDFNAIRQRLHAQDPATLSAPSSGEMPTHGTNKMQRVRELEHAFFRPTCRIAMSSYSTITIDDELVGSRSKDLDANNVSFRKAHKEGAKNDVAADAFFRTVFTVLHKERSRYSHDTHVNAVLDEIKAQISETSNVLLSVDRGYSKMTFWKEAAKRDFRFVTVCSPTSQGDQPFSPKSRREELEQKHEAKKAEAERAGMSCGGPSFAADEFVINDDPGMGPAIFSAETKVESSRTGAANKATLHAIAVRERGKGGGTQVVPFVIRTNDALSKLARFAFVMDRHTRNSRGASKRVLFYPRQAGLDLPEHLLEIEQELKEHCVPLTAAQRTADWFVLRQFMITGTTGQQIALWDDDARTVLLRNPRLGANRQGEQKDEFLVDLDVPLRTDKEVFNKLRKTWHYAGKRSGTSDTSTGTINEDAIFDAVKAQAFVTAIFEIGLVQSRTNKFMGVSSDAVALVRKPGADADDRPHIASVEFKTRIAPATLTEFINTAQVFGTYFECRVGDPTWFQAIPRVHRGQIIHQACVLGTQFVLYVAASVGAIQFCCLVLVTDDVKDMYESALGKWKHLMSFAHGLLDSDDPNFHPSLPEECDDDDAAVVLSHLPMWYAVRRKVKDEGPLHPVRQFRSFIQWWYSTLKCGVDGMSENLELLETKSMRFNWDKLFIVRSLKMVVYNTFILWRLSSATTSRSTRFGANATAPSPSSNSSGIFPSISSEPRHCGANSLHLQAPLRRCSPTHLEAF
ncbi:YqaJ domain-containing protein [Durusdinium trenchii]|uniref:YqaJ domain-containing protein n=1 Tax=Durusdinium trenchii TaxID=1381693 RepID=A0ABP0QSV4_9DINO